VIATRNAELAGRRIRRAMEADGAGPAESRPYNQIVQYPNLTFSKTFANPRAFASYLMTQGFPQEEIFPIIAGIRNDKHFNIGRWTYTERGCRYNQISGFRTDNVFEIF